MESSESFEHAQELFKNKERFQNAYNTLRKALRSKSDFRQETLDLHQNTQFRLLKSFYHLRELKYLKPYLGKSVSTLRMIFLHYEDFLSSVCSSLDALGYEINDIYQLNLGKYIDIRKVMSELPEGPLNELLQIEIQPQNKNHWSSRLIQQRNTAVHRQTGLLGATIQTRVDLEKEEMSQDVVASGTKVFDDSEFYYDKVESLIADAYRHLRGRVVKRRIMCKGDIKGELLSVLECPYCGVLAAWREKRTVENWPTEEEKDIYDLVNYEKQMTLRSTAPISLFREEKPTKEEVESSIVDLEDTVCILEKLPEVSCPGCKAEVMIVDKSVGKGIQRLLRESGSNIPLDIAEGIYGRYDFFVDWGNENAEVLLSDQCRVRRSRYYRGKELEDKTVGKTTPVRRGTTEVIDEYDNRKIYRKPRGVLLDSIECLVISPTKDIQEEWYEQDPERTALFLKDRNKAVSLLEKIAADEYYDRGNIAESKALYEKSVERNAQNGGALAKLGVIDILEGNEKKGVTKCLKAGEISQECYFSDIGLAFYRREDLEKAREWFKKDLDHKPTAQGAYNLGIIAYEDNKPEERVQWLEKSLQLDPEYWDSCILLGSIYDEGGRIDDAIRILEEGMKRIIDKDEEGRHFYKEEEKAKKMHSLLKELKSRNNKG